MFDGIQQNIPLILAVGAQRATLCCAYMEVEETQNRLIFKLITRFV